MFSQTSGAAVDYKLYVAIGSVNENFKTDSSGRYYFAYTAAGTYYLTPNGFTNNGNDSTIVTNKTEIDVPSAINRTYNGTTQVGVLQGTGYTRSGIYEAIEANTYIAYVTPNYGYCWPDGSTERKSVIWSIVKASQPSLTFTNSATVIYGSTLTLGLSGIREEAAVSYSVISGGTGAGTIGGNIFTPTKAGTVKIRALTDPTRNYERATKDMTVTVARQSIAGASVTLPNASYVYTGSGITPTPSVTSGGKTLTKDVDYTVSYSDNTSFGQATVTIGGKGNYTGTASATFTVARKDIGASDVLAADIPAVTYNGSPYAPEPTLTYNGNTLILNTDYTLSYANNTGAGTATVAVTGKGNYAGVKTLNFTINKADQSFSVTGDAVLECLDRASLGVSGVYSGGARAWSSDKPAVLGVDNAGRIAAHRVGVATITLSIDDDANYNAGAATFKVTTTLTNGFFIGNIGSETGHTIYATLNEAVRAAAGGADKTVFIKGAPTVGETVNVAEHIAIEGYGANATLARDSGFTGSLLRISTGGGLSLRSLALDGRNAAGQSLVMVDGGALTLGELSSAGVASGGVTLKNGSAASGGAINVGAGGSLTVNAATFTGNVAERGGAIYIDDGAGAVALNGGAMSNNHATVLGDAVYMNDRGLTMDGRARTAGVTDGLGIAGKAQIRVTGGVEHKVSVEFADSAAQMTEEPPYVSYVTGDGIAGAALKEYFRVVNSGYTFNGEAAANALVLQKSILEVARYKDAGGIWHTFMDLRDAINAAAAESGGVRLLLVQYVNDKTPALTTDAIELTESLVIPDGADITFGSVVKHTDASGSNYKYETPAKPTVLRRGDSMTGEMIRVSAGARLTLGGGVVEDVDTTTAGDQPSLGEVILDGGANFGGSYGAPVITDDGKGGAGTVVTNNTGVTAHAPVIVNKGALNIESGATIRNNDNNYAKPGLGFGSQNYGGGVRNEGAGALTMTGGKIENCYSREGGAIVNVNKPKNSDGSPNADYAPAPDGPAVTIGGGEIVNNASQMKGAAIQTIYGRAATTVTVGAVIRDNVSLRDLGALAVEEGGSLTLSGGTVSAGGTNAHAVYVYNKYGKDDYGLAVTKPYIEGVSAAKLKVTGSPSLTGDVRLDAPCTVVNSDPAMAYEPVIDLAGYTGGDISVDIADAGGVSRPYGKLAVSSSDNLGKLKITYPDAVAAIGDRYGVRSVAGEKYVLAFGGYDLTIGQSEPGKLDVKGVCDPSVAAITVTIGDRDFTLTADGGKITGTLDLAGRGMSGVSNGAKITFAYAGAAAQEKTFAGGFDLIYLDKTTGRVTAPIGAQYIAADGAQKPLKDGTLPNDLLIDAGGNARFVVGGETRTLAVGTRAEKPDGGDPTLGGGKTDLTDGKATVKAGDFEYNLVDKDGNLVFGDWKKPTDGKVDFSGLVADSDYTVVARRPADGAQLPSVFITVPDAGFHTLTTADARKKASFETAYGQIKDKLYNGGGAAAGTATAAAIAGVLRDNYAALTDDVKTLPAIAAAKDDLDDGLRHAQASEWRAAHAAALDKPLADVTVAADDDNVAGALTACEALPNGAKELLTVEHADLLAKAKKLAAEKIAAAYDASSRTEQSAAIKNEYIAEINAAGVNAKADIDRLTARATAALEARTEYDEIVAAADKMTGQSLVELKKALDKALTDIASADTAAVGAAKDAAILELHRAKAIGLTDKYYGDIAAGAAANGITRSLAAVTGVRDDAIDYFAAADRTLAELKAKPADAFLALDKAEGKAILTDYLEETDADDIKALVTAPSRGACAAIDGATANDNGEIAAIVAAAKLAVEKERAKDAVERAAAAYPTTAGDAIADDFVNNVIDAAGNTENARLLAERAIAKIALEKSRADRLAEIDPTDPNSGEKTDAVNAVINGAAAEIDAAGGADEITAARIRAEADAGDVIANYDRDKFVAAHNGILSVGAEGLTAADGASIAAALSDLAENYIEASQTAMDDLRNDLLAKKKAVAAIALSALKDGTSADGVLNGYIGKVNAVGVAGGIGEDAAAAAEIDRLTAAATKAVALEKHKNAQIAALENGRSETDSAAVSAVTSAAQNAIAAVVYDESATLDAQKAAVDALTAQALADILLQRQKDAAKAEFDRCYGELTGETDLSGAAAIAAREAIDGAADLGEVNAALGGSVKETAEALLLAGDSAETRALVGEVCAAVDRLTAAATAAGETARLLDAIASLRGDVGAQRAAEKAAAVSNLTDRTFDECGDRLPAKVVGWLDAAKKEIENGVYDGYPLVEKKLFAKIAALKRHDELAASAVENGYKGAESLTEGLDEACAAIDDAPDAAGVTEAARAAATLLAKKSGAIEVENYVGKSDSTYAENAAAEGVRKIEALAGDATEAEIRAAVADAKNAVDAERFLDGNMILRKDFAAIGAGGADALQRAADAFAELTDGVRHKLDAAAQGGGYSDFAARLDDMRRKAEFEREKAETIARVKALLHSHDGNRVIDTLDRQIALIDSGVVCGEHYDDDDRDGDLQKLIADLENAYAAAAVQVKFAQKQQRTENQLAADAGARLDSGRYNKDQQAKIENILSDARVEIDAVVTGAGETEQATANAALDGILTETKDKLSAVPVTSAVQGDLKPDKTSESGEGAAEYPDDAFGEVWGIVSNDAGLDSAIRLVIEKTDKRAIAQIADAARGGKLRAAEGSELDENGLKTLVDGKEVKGSLDIYLQKGDVKITEFAGKYVVKILLTSDTRGAVGLQVVYLEDDGGVQIYDTRVEDGKYLVFTTTHFSEFYILGEPVIDLWWLIVLLSVALAAECVAACLIARRNKKRRKSGNNGAKGGVKTYSFLPAGLLGAVIVPAPAVIVCCVLGGLVVAAGGVIVALLIKGACKASAKRDASDAAELADARKESLPAMQGGASDAAAREREAADAATSVAATAADTAALAPPAAEDKSRPSRLAGARSAAPRGKAPFIAVKYNKSFKAKLIQSGDAQKRFYAELKNELLSYGAKSRAGWKRETFRGAGVTLARFEIRGKGLCVYLALDPAAYAGTKYAVENFSRVAAAAKVPCLYRVKNPLRCRYAKELIAAAAAARGLPKTARMAVDYAAELPYETTEALIEKKLVRAVAGEVPRGGSLAKRKSVAAAEVGTLMNDAAAAAFVETSARRSDRARRSIVNIDVLNAHFADGETVTLDAIKKRVRGFDKKATYVKILARGSLGKALIVEADAFSPDAVKMIALTGGRALKKGGL